MVCHRRSANRSFIHDGIGESLAQRRRMGQEWEAPAPPATEP